MNPGNPVQNYLKCFMEQQKFFFDSGAVQRREQLLVMPLKELPAQELLDYGGFALSQADWAARLDAIDWQILLKLKTDGVGVLLPDVQQFQPLANALKVRFRAEVALGRFDAALRTAKTLFAMARHLGEHPTLVGNLEGFAVAKTAIGPLEEMLEQPGCPNLYWALTNLPIPLVSLEKGIGRRTRHLPRSVPRPRRDRPDEPGPAQEIRRAPGSSDRRCQTHQAGRGGAAVARCAEQGRGKARRRSPASRRIRVSGAATAGVSRPTSSYSWTRNASTRCAATTSSSS